MNQKELIEIIKAMKHEILDLLINQNMADDEVAQQTLSTINSMFKQLDLEIDDVIPRETLVAYFGGVDEATKLLDKSGIDPKYGLGASISSKGIVRSSFNSRVHLEAIAEITDNTMLDLKAAIRTAQRSANASIETALKAVKSDLQGGIVKGNPREVITQRVAEAFSKEGMTSFITSDEKALPLDFYTETVTRTQLKQANIKGAAERYRQNGMDLYIVTGNTPTCHQCAPLRGIVFTQNPNRTDYTYLNPEDIQRHPNCQCSMSVWVESYKSKKEIEQAQSKSLAFNPDKDTRSKTQKEAYKKMQAHNRQNNYEKKRYADIKGLLGDDAPANLGAFKRMKRANTENYQMLLQDYQDALKSIK